jgi:predicted 2-oxoglutarate/Fe(II)-dependent dioxygenase YbiX
LLDDVVARAFQEHIIPRTGTSIDWYEQPQLLRYAPGGYYVYHSDAYDFEIEQRAWRKAADRDISLLLYLNDEYTGGELEFKRLAYTLSPKAGMLVWFPSDIRYEHMARLVKSGRRFVIVSWAAASGVERVRPERPKRAISWPSREKAPAR